MAWARTDPFSDVTGNQKGNLATLASDRCLRVFNASTKNFKNVSKTHRCKLRVPVTRDKVKEDNAENNLSTKVRYNNTYDRSNYFLKIGLTTLISFNN